MPVIAWVGVWLCVATLAGIGLLLALALLVSVASEVGKW